MISHAHEASEIEAKASSFKSQSLYYLRRMVSQNLTSSLLFHDPPPSSKGIECIEVCYLWDEGTIW